MILFHVSAKSNRKSIAAHGLLASNDQTGFGAIYLSNKRDPEISEAFDCWSVDCTNLAVEEDVTTNQDEDQFGKWYMSYEDIPPNRLLLNAQAI